MVCGTARRRGKVIIPSFAVGRTQEIVYALNQLDASGDIPENPVFVDSPLAVNATDVFRMHPESWDTNVQTFLEDGRRRSPFDYPRIEYVREVLRSKQLNHMTESAIIISASGMAESGRILLSAEGREEKALWFRQMAAVCCEIYEKLGCFWCVCVLFCLDLIGILRMSTQPS